MNLFIPPVANAKAHFRSTTDIGHHHGSFVGQYCQGQAQEITVEVILCKYSRQMEGGARLARARALGNGVVYSKICARRRRRYGERQVFIPNAVQALQEERHGW